MNLERLKQLNNIHTSWEEYMYTLLNSTPDPLREIWRDKLITSICHWKWDTGSISEGNFAGLQILSELPNELTMKVCDYKIDPDEWVKYERLARSKRINVTIGEYPQESLSEMARKCIHYILEHFDEYGHLFAELPSLKRIWKFAQEAKGECIIPDEALTLMLEKEVHDEEPQSWIGLADLLYKEGHSGKYAEYMKHDKIEGYPFATKLVNINGVELPVLADVDEDKALEEAAENVKSVVDVFLKEDVAWSPCYKKICICILKNDVTMKYAGFGATLKERQARENAMAAFSTKQNEKEKAKAEAERLVKKIEKERLENGAE